MTLKGRNWSSGRRSYLIVTLSNTNLTWTPLRSEQCLCCDLSLTDRLSRGRAAAHITTHRISLHLTDTPCNVILPKRKRSWRPSNDSKFLQRSDNKVLHVQGALHCLLFCRPSRNSRYVLSRVLTWTCWRPVTTTGQAEIFLVLFSSMILGWEV